jgi:NarL family two-component system response regulator LiaR
MKRHVLIYGILGGILITVLQWSQYHFLIVKHAEEIYVGLIAAIFAALGIWLGIKLNGPRQRVLTEEIAVPAAAPAPEPSPQFIPNERKREDLNITRRELEILQLVAQGMSNREIAGKLYVSENTVKTHCSRTFDKLGAARRTQAVQRGKELGLLP